MRPRPRSTLVDPMGPKQQSRRAANSVSLRLLGLDAQFLLELPCRPGSGEEGDEIESKIQQTDKATDSKAAAQSEALIAQIIRQK